MNLWTRSSAGQGLVPWRSSMCTGECSRWCVYDCSRVDLMTKRSWCAHEWRTVQHRKSVKTSHVHSTSSSLNIFHRCSSIRHWQRRVLSTICWLTWIWTVTRRSVADGLGRTHVREHSRWTGQDWPWRLMAVLILSGRHFVVHVDVCLHEYIQLIFSTELLCCITSVETLLLKAFCHAIYPACSSAPPAIQLFFTVAVEFPNPACWSNHSAGSMSKHQAQQEEKGARRVAKSRPVRKQLSPRKFVLQLKREHFRVQARRTLEQMASQLKYDVQFSRYPDFQKHNPVLSSTEKSVTTLCKCLENLTLTRRQLDEAKVLLKATGSSERKPKVCRHVLSLVRIFPNPCMWATVQLTRTEIKFNTSFRVCNCRKFKQSSTWSRRKFAISDPVMKTFTIYPKKQIRQKVIGANIRYLMDEIRSNFNHKNKYVISDWVLCLGGTCPDPSVW